MRTARYGGRLGLLTKTIAIAAASAALLAACGGNAPEPGTGAETKPPAEPSAPSKTPSPTRSLSLDEKRVMALNTASAWLVASNKAHKTLDPAPMLALSTPDCKFCQDLAKGMRTMKANGGRFEGDYVEHMIGSRAEPDLSPPKVRMNVRRGAWSHIEKAGAQPSKFEKQIYDYEFGLKWEGGKWVVASVTPR